MENEDSTEVLSVSHTSPNSGCLVNVFQMNECHKLIIIKS